MRLIFALLSALIGLIIFMHPWRHSDDQDAGVLANPDPLIAMHNIHKADQDLHEQLKALGVAPPENDDILPPDSLNLAPRPPDTAASAPPPPAPKPAPPDRFFVHHNEISVDDTKKDTVGFSENDDAADTADDEPLRPAHHYYEISVGKDSNPGPAE